MFAMMKRNLQLYFSSKASVFFSLMGAWIAFALYVVFLQKNILDAWSTASHPEEMLDKWVMGGTLAVTSMTTTWTGAAKMVQDKESHKLDDFLMTDLSPMQLNLGYLLSSAIIGFLMQLVMYGIMSAYFYWQDGLMVNLENCLALLGTMILSSLLGASLSLIMVQFIRQTEVSDRLSIIIGTVSGFLVGVYVPIGSLPDPAQTVMKLTPGAYVAAAFRQILIGDQIISWGQSKRDIKEFLGIGLDLNGLTSLKENLLIVGGVLGVALLVLAVIQLVKKSTLR